jgi:hypothetical protein
MILSARHCFCCSYSTPHKNEIDFGDKYVADSEGDRGSHALDPGPDSGSVRTAVGCRGEWWTGAEAVCGIQTQTHHADRVGGEQTSLSLMLSQHCLYQELSPVQAVETRYQQCQDC